MPYGFAEHGSNSLKNNRNIQEHIHSTHFKTAENKDWAKYKHLGSDLYKFRQNNRPNKFFGITIFITIVVVIILFLIMWKIESSK